MSMTKIKNISGVDRNVPGLGGRLVIAGAVVEVPDEDAESYLQQTEVWGDPSVKPPAKKAAARKRTAKKTAAKKAAKTPADHAAETTDTAPAENEG